jgi:hypothetical protein
MDMYFNRKIDPKYIIVEKNIKKDKDQVVLARWKVGLFALVTLLLITVLIAALLLVLNTPPPGFYLQSCDQRSCASGFNLKCINKVCNCTETQYYVDKCLEKKTDQELCRSIRECREDKNLICFDGKCQCSDVRYWNGQKCINRRIYNERCIGNECLSKISLECDKTTGLCDCNSSIR